MKKLREPNTQAPEPKGEPDEPEVKKPRGRLSPYKILQKNLDQQDSLRVADDGTVQIVNRKGEVLATQMPTARLQRYAEENGLTIQEAMVHQHEGQAMQNAKDAFRRFKGWNPDRPVRSDTPGWQEFWNRACELGLFPYNPSIAKEITARYAAGERLANFLGKPGFPTYKQFVQWRIRNKEFDEAIDSARARRADRHIEEIEFLADETDSWNAKGNKVKIDALKHLAAVQNPDKYGSRVKMVGDPDQPMAFTVVSRVPDADKPEELKVIDEKSS